MLVWQVTSCRLPRRFAVLPERLPPLAECREALAALASPDYCPPDLPHDQDEGQQEGQQDGQQEGQKHEHEEEEEREAALDQEHVVQGTDGRKAEAAAAARAGATAQAGAGGGGGSGSCGEGATTNAHKRQRSDDATAAAGGVLAPDPDVAGAARLYGKPWTWPVREELLLQQQQQAGAPSHRSGHGAQGPHAHGRRPPSLLHDEVVAFARESAPREGELRQLQAALAAVQRVASSMWPTARVVLFGSQVGYLAG